MGRRGRLKAGRWFQALGITCGCVMPVLAQDGGRTVTMTVSPRLAWSDNYDFQARNKKSGLRPQTALSFAYSDVTPTQAVEFSTGGLLEYADGEFSSTDPTLNFSYRREGASTLLTGRLTYSDTDASQTSNFYDDNGILQEVVSSGRRRDIGANVGLQFGIGGPFGGSLDLTHATTKYRDTAPNAALYDSRYSSARGRLNFVLDPQVTLRTTASVAKTVRDGNYDTDYTSYGVGAIVGFSQVWTADMRLDWQRTERTGTINDSSQGLGAGVVLTREMQNGTLSGEVSSDVGDNGRRDRASLRRALELQTATLAFSAGVTRTEGSSIKPLFGLEYMQELPRATLNATLNQSVATDADGRDTIYSSFQLGYRRDLTSTSSMSASANFQNQQALSSNGTDAKRLDVSLSYHHDLTEDWGMVGSYTHRISTSSTSSDVSANTVYLGLERNFTWRP